MGRKGDKTVLELDGGGYLIVWTNYPDPGGSSALKISRRRCQSLGREHLTNSPLRHWSCSSLCAFSFRGLYCSLFCCDLRTVEKRFSLSCLFVLQKENLAATQNSKVDPILFLHFRKGEKRNGKKRGKGRTTGQRTHTCYRHLLCTCRSGASSPEHEEDYQDVVLGALSV